MMKDALLILDLDNTIFNTYSIPSSIFQPTIDVINGFYATINDLTTAKNILADLWSNAPDVVFDKYNVPEKVRSEFIQTLQTMSYQLDIQPFEDYTVLRDINAQKILVTTGYQGLQMTKIQALGIRQDFESIYIDDPLEENRIHKIGVFRKILSNVNINLEKIWVIGDQPQSEIKAGKMLGLKTVQRLKKGEKKSDLADFSIMTFDELPRLLSNFE